MNNASLRAILVTGALFLCGGCKSSHEEAVAHVGKSPITLTDFTSRLRAAPPEYQQYAASPEGRRQFLNVLIREKVLLTESKKAGFDKQDDYRKAITRYKEKTERDLSDYQDSLLVDMYLSQLRSKEMAVSDADIRRYYDDHASQFAHPVEIQASHILVNSQEEAETALKRVKGGEPFEAVAQSMSIDAPTAVRGGKLKPFSQGELLPEFENAVTPLKIGQVSDVVKSPFGYHIIKKNAERALPPRPLDGFITVSVRGEPRKQAVKDMIRSRLERDKFDQWVAKAETSLGVKIDEKALAAVAMSPAQQQAGSMNGERSIQ